MRVRKAGLSGFVLAVGAALAAAGRVPLFVVERLISVLTGGCRLAILCSCYVHLLCYMSFMAKSAPSLKQLEEESPGPFPALEAAVEKERRRGRGAQSNASGRYEAEARVAFDDGWQSIEDLPPFKTTVGADSSRKVITRNDSPDIGFDRSINPYRGCEHGCVYCFARPTHAYLGLSPGLDFESKLLAKPDAPAENSAISYSWPTIPIARPGWIRTISSSSSSFDKARGQDLPKGFEDEFRAGVSDRRCHWGGWQ